MFFFGKLLNQFTLSWGQSPVANIFSVRHCL
jgi:hypothetical protein